MNQNIGYYLVDEKILILLSVNLNKYHNLNRNVYNKDFSIYYCEEAIVLDILDIKTNNSLQYYDVINSNDLIKNYEKDKIIFVKIPDEIKRDDIDYSTMYKNMFDYGIKFFVKKESALNMRPNLLTSSKIVEKGIYKEYNYDANGNVILIKNINKRNSQITEYQNGKKVKSENFNQKGALNGETIIYFLNQKNSIYSIDKYDMGNLQYSVLYNENEIIEQIEINKKMDYGLYENLYKIYFSKEGDILIFIKFKYDNTNVKKYEIIFENNKISDINFYLNNQLSKYNSILKLLHKIKYIKELKYILQDYINFFFDNRQFNLILNL
jgi:hypothetical protein